MKIIFDLRSTGLGNNGGSLTLIKSANTLSQLGHNVIIVDSSKNKHTWNKLNVPHVVAKNIKDVPNADIIIATGYKSVKHVVAAPQRCGLKMHWIRGWEAWRMPEKQIVRDVLKAPTIKIVNSNGLQKKLSSYNVSSHIIRPGYDFDEIYPTKYRKLAHRKNAPIIGGLYHLKHKTKRSDWIIRFRNENKNVSLWMFGVNLPVYSYRRIDQYFLSPSIETKREIYNSCAIWLSTSKNEGLHIVPAEAMLTECPVVGTNAPMAGLDYLIDGQTGLISENNYEAFSKKVRMLLFDTNLQRELGKNARNRILEIGDRKTNMTKMIELFETFL